jgi:hypothetical protein
MTVKTTISFHDVRLVRINRLLETSPLDLQELIKRCLKKIAPKVRKMRFCTGTLEYQPVTKAYETEHFAMSNSEYEIYMDLKKISKCTLSLLIAIALDLYAEKIILTNFEDSYQTSKYLACKYISNSRPFLIYSWDEEVKDEETYKIQIE